jgi:hypothetical protein
MCLVWEACSLWEWIKSIWYVAQGVVQVRQDKQRQRLKESTQEFREPQHCILHMYNNKEHGNTIYKVSAQKNIVLHQVILNIRSYNNN